MNADRIIENLWMGSRPTGSLPPGEFDVVVLAAAEVQPPREWFCGAKVLRLKLDDGELTPEEADAAEQAAEIVASELAQGRSALVTCNMGINRSGLVTALVLKRLGMTGRKAVKTVRDRRKAQCGIVALSNSSFVEYVLA